MPFVSATLCAQPSSSLTARAVLALTDLTEKVLGKERSRTTVAVQYVPEAQWGRGGAIPASGLSWQLQLQHCAPNQTCHVHVIQTWAGVSGGSFTAPDHEYPSYLELSLTVV